MTAKQPKRIPSFRHHKASGQGFVELAGRRHYLGRFDRPETQQAYHRLMAEWIANGRQLPVDPSDITIVELCARFWQHAKAYYRRPNGTPTSEIDNVRLALRSLKALYGSTTAAHFGPRALKTVRQQMIDQGGCRTYINRHIGRVKLMFKWAVAEGLIEPSVYHGLQAVAGLKRGRSEARESESVKPVPDAHVKAVRRYLSRQAWALIQLQLLTAARSGELVVMRSIDLDTHGHIWTYSPADHKTAHHGHTRTIYLGPKAQAVVRPFMAGRAVDTYLFSPQDAEAERRAALHAARKTPMSYGNVHGSNRRDSPRRRAGEHYTTGSYRRALQRACVAADVPQWSPHRLRHSAGTNIRREFGVEAAQLLLGHARADVTQLYAEVNHAKALEIAAKVG
ncbi:MAG: site-specific integrase [Planctomycetes bacterium]|nr:site-specific integrase [Planctomycetota bacterium]